MLYKHLPRDLPDGWIASSYVPATHYLAWPLFNEPNEFRDVFLRYLALKEVNTALYRAASHPPKHMEASRKEERDALMQRRSVFMGTEERDGASNWDARIRSWIGLSDRAGGTGELRFSSKLLPIKRESLEELMWRLGLQPMQLPAWGWCGRRPYHSIERRWRESDGTLPTKLPKELKEKLLKPMRENPELKDLTEEELAGVLFLLRANPPYSMAREHDQSALTDEQKARIAREDALAKTRIITQLFAAREVRALAALRRGFADYDS